MNFLDIIGYIIGTLGALASGVYYLRYVATRSNIEGKDETIKVLETSNVAYRGANEDLTKEVTTLRGQNKALQQIVTNTPEIIKLTRSVADLAEGIAKQHRETTKQNQHIVEVLTDLVATIKGSYGKDHEQPATEPRKQ